MSSINGATKERNASVNVGRQVSKIWKSRRRLLLGTEKSAGQEDRPRTRNRRGDGDGDEYLRVKSKGQLTAGLAVIPVLYNSISSKAPSTDSHLPEPVSGAK